MKQLVLSVFAGIGYSLAFHAGSWALCFVSAFEWMPVAVAAYLPWVVWLLVLAPGYFLTMHHVADRWLYRGSAFLSFVFFGWFAYFLIDRFASAWDGFGYTLLLLVMAFVMGVIFLADLLVGLVRHAKRCLRSRSA